MDVEPKEHSDLLGSKQKNSNKTDDPNGCGDQPVTGPPDGGFKAYSVMVGSFLTNGLLFGVINSYSVIYKVLLKNLKEDKVENVEIRAALVGVLTIGTTFILSPVSGVLTAFLGLRRTAVLGGSVAALGLLLSSFAVRHVDLLMVTYGLMYGLGASLAYTPSLAILGHYFKKYLGIVNGIVTIGSSVFTVIISPLIDFMINNYGLAWMFRLLSLITVGIALCGLLFKPVPVVVIDKPLKKNKSVKNILKTIGNVQLWRNSKYKLWAFSMPVALFGYFVPYVHIKEFIEYLKFENVNDNLPLQCLAATSGVGRLLFGFLGDRRGINKIMLQQISFYVIGTLTIILPFVNSFGLLVAIALGIGLFEGGFISLIGPIAFELCGPANAAQAIGFMLGTAAIPVSIGPPVAGAILKATQSYTLPFVMAGISPLVGATLMFTIHFRNRGPKQPTQTHSNGHLAMATVDVEKSAESPLSSNGNINQQGEPH